MISGLKSTLFLLAAGVLTKAAIGPVATLNIGHKDISPDGFTRKYAPSYHFYIVACI